MNLLVNAVRGLTDLVFPRACAGCGGPVGDESPHICWNCLASLWPIQRPYCSICGDPIWGCVEHEFICAACSARRPGFDAARSAMHYDGRMAEILQEFKYRRASHLSHDLAVFLLQCVRTHYSIASIDALVPVPLHRRKERERTYNQARLLARDLAGALGKPLLTQILVRCRATPTQTRLTASERRENVRGAFVPRNENWIEGRRLLLVDDVMTTGATVDECARVLKSAGAAVVKAITVARGV